MADPTRYGTARAEWSPSAAVNAGMSSLRYIYSDDDIALKDLSGERPVMRVSAERAPHLRQRVARRVAWITYRALRPVVRSVAWRTRSFMAHDLHEFSLRVEHMARHSENLAREQHAQLVTLLSHAEAHAQLTAAEHKRSLRALTTTLDQQAKRISLLGDEVVQLRQAIHGTGTVDD